MGALVARTRRVDRPLDLVALAGSDGVVFERRRAGLAGRGCALRVPIGDAVATLGAMEVDDDVRAPGTGPVAFGAVPFAPGAATELVVPEVVWGHAEDGTRWVTTVGDVDPVLESPPAPRADPPSTVTVAPTRAASWWRDLVATAAKAIAEAAEGELQKVVLAREVTVEASSPFDAATVVERLRRAYPDCFCFSIEGFVGASPELLVARAGDIVRAQPMAGTAPRGGDPATDAQLAANLLASTTYRQEHQVTIDMVYDALLAHCSYLDYEPEPSVVAMANVQHLATTVEGRLSAPPPAVTDLVQLLHPTPAVAGWPRPAAVRWILDHEGFDRGRYAGAVGWVDAQGNGTWAVSVRCAELDGRTARLCAGGGVLASSDPERELAETQAKLQALLSVLVRV